MTKFQPTKKLTKPEKIVISIRIDEEKLKLIDKFANNHNLSRNEFINQCLDYALDNIDEENKVNS